MQEKCADVAIMRKLPAEKFKMQESFAECRRVGKYAITRKQTMLLKKIGMNRLSQIYQACKNVTLIYSVTKIIDRIAVTRNSWPSLF